MCPLETSLTPSQSEFTLGAFITSAFAIILVLHVVTYTCNFTPAGYNGNIGGLIEFNVRLALLYCLGKRLC